MRPFIAPAIIVFVLASSSSESDDSSVDGDSPATGIEVFVVAKLSARSCATTIRLAVSEGLIPDNPVANGSVFGLSSGAVKELEHHF